MQNPREKQHSDFSAGWLGVEAGTCGVGWDGRLSNFHKFVQIHLFIELDISLLKLLQLEDFQELYLRQRLNGAVINLVRKDFSGIVSARYKLPNISGFQT